MKKGPPNTNIIFIRKWNRANQSKSQGKYELSHPIYKY